MYIKMLKSKLHRAVATETNLDYSGSITIDQDLMDRAGLLPNEAVLVADINNGTRHETYVIAGPRGKGEICINGAAARLVNVGDRLIVLSFLYLPPDKAATHRVKVVVLDDKNNIKEIRDQ